MTSQAKIEANQRNSLKSTGPSTPEGLLKMKCINGFFRGIETFRKYQGKKRGEGPERRIDDGRLSAEDSRRRIGDAGRWAAAMDASDHVPDGSFGVGDGEREALEPSIDWDAWPDRGAQPDCGTGTAGATQSASASMMADTTLSDGPYQCFGQCHPSGRYHPAGNLGA